MFLCHVCVSYADSICWVCVGSFGTTGLKRLQCAVGGGRRGGQTDGALLDNNSYPCYVTLLMKELPRMFTFSPLLLVNYGVLSPTPLLFCNVLLLVLYYKESNRFLVVGPLNLREAGRAACQTVRCGGRHDDVGILGNLHDIYCFLMTRGNVQTNRDPTR